VSRVLRADGIALLTIKAVIDGDVDSRVGSTYRRGRGGVYRPKGGGAIAYDDALIRSMIDDAHLDLCAFELGTWHKSSSVGPGTDARSSSRPGADLYVVTPRTAG